MAVKFPDTLEHNNSSKALFDNSQIRGGAVTVADLTARNDIPSDKRMIGMLVTYYDGAKWATKRYEGSDILDATWVTSGNWVAITSSGEADNPFDQDLNTTNQVKFLTLDINGGGIFMHGDGATAPYSSLYSQIGSGILFGSKVEQVSEIKQTALGDIINLKFNEDGIYVGKGLFYSLTRFDTVIDGSVPIFCPLLSNLTGAGGDTGYGGSLTKLRMYTEGNEVLSADTSRVSLKGAVKTTTGDPSLPESGDITINEFDNVIKIYADGAWRSIANW